MGNYLGQLKKNGQWLKAETFQSENDVYNAVIAYIDDKQYDAGRMAKKTDKPNWNWVFFRTAPKPAFKPKIIRQDGDKNWDVNCQNCGATPTVHPTQLCGPCCFGEADTAGGNW